MFKIALVAIFALLCISGTASADLDVLIEVAQGQGEIQKQYKKEDESYKCVKRAVENKYIKKGVNKKDISQKYGEPVVDFKDTYKKMEKWIYKPAKASFFGGEQIAIYFNDNGTVEEVEVRAEENTVQPTRLH